MAGRGPTETPLTLTLPGGAAAVRLSRSSRAANASRPRPGTLARPAQTPPAWHAVRGVGCDGAAGERASAGASQVASIVSMMMMIFLMNSAVLRKLSFGQPKRPGNTRQTCTKQRQFY